ncbi:hypothetical protein A1O1_03440 [Capronia coronata CBS 617.96]|uniref:Guanylate cyclase domain-containing protein n=1 Tax=Capronia coronata CBS 617.96 TaxID=1182541 RepID=W9YMA7_9EURO|nr:uncharacterized protein A1O1_03440 [Capronia coronata CBS 617.96]EXJ90341.1 hypothetical protein A1O1_03440 [Capronia coronata CBS 617.96]
MPGRIRLREVTSLRTVFREGAIRRTSSSRRASLPLQTHARQVHLDHNVMLARSTVSGGARALSTTGGGRYHQSNTHYSTTSGVNADSNSEPVKHDEAEGDRHRHREPAVAVGAQAAKQPDTEPSPPPQGSLSIVFTDIVKSTAIWEQDETAMMQAMQLHDHMVRHLTEANHGYEVKQNGDGFMIAFPTATAAVQFCLDVQEQLLDENWPREILKLTPGKETKDSDGHLLFRGLQLRMSAHWGRPVCNWNDVIQRMDYLGPMVNRAARFIEATEAGQIVVSEEFLIQLQGELEMEVKSPSDAGQEEQTSTQQSQTTVTDDCSSAGDTGRASVGVGVGVSDKDQTRTENRDEHESVDLGILRSKKGQRNLTHQRFEVRLLGDHEFRGLDDPQKLYFLVPRSLEGRVEHWQRVTHVPGVKGNVQGGAV